MFKSIAQNTASDMFKVLGQTIKHTSLNLMIALRLGVGKLVMQQICAAGNIVSIEPKTKIYILLNTGRCVSIEPKGLHIH